MDEGIVMSSPGTCAQLSDHRAMLLVCNPEGKVQAITSSHTSDGLSTSNISDRDFGEFFGQGSAANRWFAARMQEARSQNGYRVEASLENGDGYILVRLESLTRDGELYGFVLQSLPLDGVNTSCSANDGDSVVTRRQWHEIKNHVGALKLYATFLKRKMPEGDERKIVEKIFGGVNALIGYLDRVRRGGPL